MNELLSLMLLGAYDTSGLFNALLFLLFTFLTKEHV